MKYKPEKAQFELSRREAKATGMKHRRKFPADLEVISCMTTSAEGEIRELKHELLDRFHPLSRQTIICFEKQLAQNEAKLKMMHYVGDLVLMQGYGAAELPPEHQEQLDNKTPGLSE